MAKLIANPITPDQLADKVEATILDECNGNKTRFANCADVSINSLYKALKAPEKQMRFLFNLLNLWDVWNEYELVKGEISWYLLIDEEAEEEINFQTI